MRIACLQFAPQVADVENNLTKADAILNEADSDDLDLDLLVLPELAFTGETRPFPFSTGFMTSSPNPSSAVRLQLQVPRSHLTLSRGSQHRHQLALGSKHSSQA